MAGFNALVDRLRPEIALIKNPPGESNMLRNFGQHNALLCGVRAARHDMIVTMDDDFEIARFVVESAR